MWKVYQFLDERGQSVIKEWLRKERVPKTQLAQFQVAILTLERLGPEGLVHGPIKQQRKRPITGIYKMKIRGNKGHVQLRPMLCYGPIHLDSEVTLLVGAIERDGKLEPKNYLEKADEHRSELIRDPKRRRRERLIGD